LASRLHSSLQSTKNKSGGQYTSQGENEMINLTRTVLLTATALLGATGAFAESRATIPFSFQAAGAQLPAGEYQVHEDFGGAGAKKFLLRSLDTGRSVFIMPGGSLGGYVNGRVEPQLVFMCADQECTLSEIWSDLSDLRYSVPKGAHKHDVEPKRTVAIRLSSERKAD
jgi:hypothetical protein